MKNQSEITEITADTLESSKALHLVWNVFEEFEAYQYSEKGVRVFRDFIESSSIEKMLANSEMIMWGCFHNSEIIGTIAAKPPNHISLLFVDKKYHRQGIARALYQKFLEYSKKDNCSEISVNSSLYAVEAYKRLGFVAIDTVQENEKGIRFVPMKHKLCCKETT